MILKKYEDLPENMKNNEVKEYYEILKHKKFSLIIKRVFDFFAALILLIILSPIMLVLALLIKLESKGPVFYRQERITKYGKNSEYSNSEQWYKMQIKRNFSYNRKRSENNKSGK